MKKSLTAFILVCGITFLQAQAPVIQWQKTYGGTLADAGGSVKPTTDGGYIFAGRTTSNDVDVTGNHGGMDWWVVKTDVLGNIQWQKTLGGTADDIAYSVVQTSDGGYAIAGWTESSDGDVTNYKGNKDCWVVKLNSTGVLQWQKTLGGSAEEEFRSIIQTADGGFACTGWSFSNNGDASGLHGFRDTWLVKLDINGNLTWQKMLGGLNDERGYTVVQTTDGGYFVSSSSSSSSFDVTANYGSLDYWVAKTDNLGNIQWQKNYGGSGEEDNRGAIQTTDGGYLITGYTASSNVDVTNFKGLRDMWLVKVDNTGVIQWQKTLGGTGDDRSGFVEQTPDGGYITHGSTNSSNGDVSSFHGGPFDYWLVKLTNTGTIEWEKTLGGTGDDQGGNVALISNGYMLLGSTTSNDGDVTNNKGSSDLWMVKLLNSCLPGSVTASMSGDTSICTGGTANLNLNFTGAAPWLYTINGGAVQSTLTASVTIPVSPAVNTTYNITSVSDNVCPSGTITGSATVLVSSAPPVGSAKVLSAPASACETSVESFTAKVVPGQNILYRWSGPAGTLFSNSIGGPFAAGPFSTSSNQVYAQLGSLPFGISGYSVCVEAYNGCGQTNMNCIWVRSKVSQPGPIAGDNSACPFSTKTYSVNIPVGAQVFNWTFSQPGATITPLTPAGNVVNVTFPAFTTGTLCVTSALSCGGSSVSPARCLTITSTPLKPGVISGAGNACGGTSETYSIVAVPGADNYTWSFAVTGALIDGNPSPYTTTSNTVSVSFPAGYNLNKELCVTANSACGISLPRCKNIGNLVPARPGSVIPTPGSWCNNSAVSFATAAVSGATTYNWSMSNGTILNGQGSTTINATWGTGTGSVSVTASNSCGTSDSRILTASPSCRIAGVVAPEDFNVFPNPAIDLLNITFTAEGGSYSAKLMNLSGQVVIENGGEAIKGNNNATLDLNGIAPGIYILEFINGSATSRTRVTVL